MQRSLIAPNPCRYCTVGCEVLRVITMLSSILQSWFGDKHPLLFYYLVVSHWLWHLTVGEHIRITWIISNKHHCTLIKALWKIYGSWVLPLHKPPYIILSRLAALWFTKPEIEWLLCCTTSFNMILWKIFATECWEKLKFCECCLWNIKTNVLIY